MNFVSNFNLITMSKKITLETVSAEVLQKMRAKVGSLLETYIMTNIEDCSAKLQNLRRKYEETGGSGYLLLPDVLPQRVKFYINGQYGNVSFVSAISGAGDYLVVYDCKSKAIRIEAYSDVAFIAS